MWLQKLIIRRFIEEKIWEKHRVRRYEIEEALAHRQAVRLRHTRDPVRSVIIGATQGGRLLKIVLEFQGKGQYFLVTAMDITAKEKRHYGKKIKDRS